MPVGGLISRIARKAPGLFKAGKAGAVEEIILPMRRSLAAHGGPVGENIGNSLRGSRNASRQAHGGYLEAVKPELDSLNPAENADLANTLFGNPAQSPRVAQLAEGMQDLFAETGSNPKRVLDSIVARGTPISEKAKVDGRRLLNMVFVQHEDDLTKALVRKHAQPLVNALKQGPFRDLAQKGVNNVLAQSGGDPTLSALRSFNTATLLGRAVIVNSSQPTLSAITAGMKPLLSTIKQFSSKRGREEARNFTLRIGEALDGAITDYLRHDLNPGKLQRASTAVLRRTGFLAVERFNRRFASAMGQHWFHDLVTKAKLGDDLALRQLKRFGIDPAKAARGQLDRKDLLEFAQNFVSETQFRLTPEELPIAASSEWWRTAMQFKTFGLKATEMMLSDIETRGLGAFAKRAIPASAAVGTIVNPIRRLTAGRSPFPEEGESWTSFLLDGAFAVGIGGLLFDAIQASERGSIPEFVGGPTVGLAEDVLSAGRGLVPGGGGSLRTTASRAIERIPTIGPAARRGFQAVTRPTPPRRGRPGRPGRAGRESR